MGEGGEGDREISNRHEGSGDDLAGAGIQS